MTTIRKLITDAMRLNRVVAANEVPSDADIRVGQEALVGMLDSMQADLLNIYTTTPRRFLLEAGVQEYTLGPALDSAGNVTGADWVIERPVRVERAVILQNPTVVFAEEPPPITLYSDTFDGSGNVFGSTPTVGGAYTEDSSVAPSFLLKRGDGTAVATTNGNPFALCVGGSGRIFTAVPFSELTAEFTLVKQVSSTFSSVRVQSFSIGYTDGPDNYSVQVTHSIGPMSGVSPVAGPETTSLTYATPAGITTNLNVSNTIAVGSSQRLGFRLTATSMQLLIDGTVAGSAPIMAGLTGISSYNVVLRDNNAVDSGKFWAVSNAQITYKEPQ